MKKEQFLENLQISKEQFPNLWNNGTFDFLTFAQRTIAVEKQSDEKPEALSTYLYWAAETAENTALFYIGTEHVETLQFELIDGTVHSVSRVSRLTELSGGYITEAEAHSIIDSIVSGGKQVHKFHTSDYYTDEEMTVIVDIKNHIKTEE